MTQQQPIHPFATSLAHLKESKADPMLSRQFAVAAMPPRWRDWLTQTLDELDNLKADSEAMKAALAESNSAMADLTRTFKTKALGATRKTM